MIKVHFIKSCRNDSVFSMHRKSVPLIGPRQARRVLPFWKKKRFTIGLRDRSQHQGDRYALAVSIFPTMPALPVVAVARSFSLHCPGLKRVFRHGLRPDSAIRCVGFPRLGYRLRGGEGLPSWFVGFAQVFVGSSSAQSDRTPQAQTQNMSTNLM